MSENLAAKIVEFCSRLRREHAFNLGPSETQDALRAIEVVGVANRARVAAALRAVCCSKAEEIELFDRAFAAFFSTAPQGVTQPKHLKDRQARPNRTNRREQTEGSQGEASPLARAQDERDVGDLRAFAQPESLSLAQAWEARHALYSPMAARAKTLSISFQQLDDALAHARRLIRRLSLAASPRWKSKSGGERFDLRRTLRASLRSGGEVILPQMLGHRPYNPRFVIIVDGSRSMSEHGGRALQFAHAFCRSTPRAAAFIFSTRLQEVTRWLRKAGRSAPYRLDDLGEAWGGGTRIGASLAEFLRKYRSRLSDQTFAIVISDGLDAGEIDQLKLAIREISRRCAAVAWINPLAGEAGYAPSARGMHAALPYVDVLTTLDDLDALGNLAGRSRLRPCA